MSYNICERCGEGNGMVGGALLQCACIRRAKIDCERGIYPTPTPPVAETLTATEAAEIDYQKCLHDFRASMGNPIPDDAQGGKFAVEVEAPVKPKTGGYATLLTWMEILTALYPGVFPETDEKREARRDRVWVQFNAAVKQMAEDQKTQPMSATAAVAMQAEENKGKFRMRVEARLDELNFVSAMAWEINQKDWFKRRVEELLEMLK